jgi:glycosyltransferase involved in cell wall biosynthesis
MRVVLFHPTRLPPRDYGGVERIVLWLAKGLAEAGHEVHVAAHEGSLLPAGVRLIGMDPRHPSALELPARLPKGVDVVHFMAPPEAEVWARLTCPGVVTVHGNGKPDEVFPMNSIFLSADHAARHGARAYVHNGIDPAEYAFTPDRKSGDYLFLSKTSWKVKNVRGAVELCRKAGVGLVVAGGRRPLGTRVRVALAPGMRWAGPVAGGRKAALLAAARALVFPMVWEEPFGLVMVEALMSGTPVLANPRGSAPELIAPAAGALPRDEAEWLDWLRNPGRLPAPEACRKLALEKFHYRRMTADYVECYRKACAGEPLQARPPRTQPAPDERAWPTPPIQERT